MAPNIAPLHQLSAAAHADVLCSWRLLAAEGPAEGPSILVILMPLVLIFFLYQMLVARPQKRDRQKVLSSIKKNERVLTIGGIFGVVTNVNEDKNEVIIRVDEATGAKLCMTLNSIARVIGEEAAGDKASSK